MIPLPVYGRQRSTVVCEKSVVEARDTWASVVMEEVSRRARSYGLTARVSSPGRASIVPAMGNGAGGGGSAPRCRRRERGRVEGKGGRGDGVGRVHSDTLRADPICNWLESASLEGMLEPKEKPRKRKGERERGEGGGGGEGWRVGERVHAGGEGASAHTK